MTLSPLLDLERHPIIAHRGASGLAPENTIASFDLAAEHGAEGFELDVRLTADGVPVVFHDSTLARTTDGHGPIAAVRSSDLPALDAGSWFTPDGTSHPFRDREVRVPTLREVLHRYPAMPLLIELKVVEAARPVHRELLANDAVGRVVVASFLDEALGPFRTAPFVAGASRLEIAAAFAASLLGLPAPRDGPALYAVPIRYKDRVPVPTRAFVRGAARRGRPVHVWTVNDAATANQLWDRGCAGMISNFPGTLLAARQARFGG